MKNLFKCSLLLAFSLMFFSCENDDQAELSTKKKSEKYTSTNVGNFVKLTGEDPNNPDKFKRTNGDGINVGIFKVKIARASTNCVDGWGFCEFEWFPDFKDMGKDEGPIVKMDLNRIEDIKNAEDHGQKLGYTYIYSAEKIPSDMPEELLNLTIDNDLQTSINKGIIAEINKGVYKFDKNIGAYGGYKIPVEITD